MGRILFGVSQKEKADGWLVSGKEKLHKREKGGGKKALDILLYISYYLLTMSRENVLGNTKQR